MQSLPTQREDSISSAEKALLRRITEEYLSLRKEDVIEIVSPYEERQFVLMLQERLFGMGIHEVHVSYTNGPIQQEIDAGYRQYLDDRISFYKELIRKKFIRVTIVAPYSEPVRNTSMVSMYRKHVMELSFLQEYLMSSLRCMVWKPNQALADHLSMSLDELWMRAEEMYGKNSLLDEKKKWMDQLHLQKLHFETAEGTDVTFTLPEDFSFTGKKILLGGRTCQPNAPSLEIFTSPVKNGGEGRIVFTKPLFYHGRKITGHEITLQAGRITSQKMLDSVLGTEESLRYVGEVALCPYDDFIYGVTLLDENSGCHIALGNSYPYGIRSHEELNHSPYHIDLIFGSKSLLCEGIRKDGSKVILLKNGKVVI